MLDSLREAGWQSDARYASSVVRSRAGRGYGPLAIRQRLLSTGIEDAGALDNIDWHAALAVAYQKKYGDSCPANREEYARRGRFLQGRGFAVEQIRHFLNQLKYQNKGE